MAMNHHRVEIGLDVEALLKTSPKRLLKGLVTDPYAPDAVSIGYMTMTPAR